MVEAPMAEAAGVRAEAAQVNAPSVVSAPSATPKRLRPVANAPHAVNAPSEAKQVAAREVATAVAHAKIATAVAAAKAEMLKRVKLTAKQPLTSTPHPKPKPRLEPKLATNAWRAKTALRARKAATTRKRRVANVLNAPNEVKAVKAVANAAHAANATKVAANARLAWTKTAIPRSCHSTTPLVVKAKPRKPMTVASVVSAAHATATAVTAVSVATVHRVKTVLQTMATMAKLLSTTALRMTRPHTNTPNKSLVSHDSRVNLASPANRVVSVKNATSALSVATAHHVVPRLKKRSPQQPWRKPLFAKACRPSKRSPCHWHRCKLWPKAAVWNGSIPTQTASLRCKLPLLPNPSQCMCHASVHPW